MPENKHTIHRPLGTVSLGIVGLFVLVMVVHDTWSLYTASALSGMNAINGGSIDLSAIGAVGNPVAPAEIIAGGSVEYGGTVENQGANTFRYHSIVSTTGDAGVCAALQISALRAGSTAYAGSVAGIGVVNGSLLSPSSDELWQFIFSLPAEASFDTGVSCIVHFTFLAWQAPYEATDPGWDDEAALPDLTLTIGGAPAVKSAETIPDASGPGPSDGTEPLLLVLPLDLLPPPIDPPAGPDALPIEPLNIPLPEITPIEPSLGGGESNLPSAALDAATISE